MRKHYRCPLLVSCLLAMLLVLGIWKVYQNILRWMEKKTLETCSNCITLLSLFQSSINLKFLKLVFEEDTNISVISRHRKIPMTTREVLLSARQQGWVWSLLYLNPSFLAHHLSQSAEFFFFLNWSSFYSFCIFSTAKGIRGKASYLSYFLSPSNHLFNAWFHLSWTGWFWALHVAIFPGTNSRKANMMPVNAIRIALLVTHWMRCRAANNLPPPTSADTFSFSSISTLSSLQVCKLLSLAISLSQ